MSTSPRHLVPLAAALLLLLAGCGGTADATPPESSDPEAHAAHTDHAAGAELAPADATDGSVYVLPSSWRDRHGEEVDLEELSGRVQVVAMVYTHCSFACPRLLAMMKKLEGAAVEAGIEDRVGFTLVSLDPARDTPGRLEEFGRSLRLEADRWTLLTGSDSDVRALSILLGVKYRVRPDGEVDHSNLITVLDPHGVPVHRLEGLAADTDPAFRAIRRALRSH